MTRITRLVRIVTTSPGLHTAIWSDGRITHVDDEGRAAIELREAKLSRTPQDAA
jgi:hypothetical protein